MISGVSLGVERRTHSEPCGFGSTTRFVAAVWVVRCRPRVVPVWYRALELFAQPDHFGIGSTDGDLVLDAP